MHLVTHRIEREKSVLQLSLFLTRKLKSGWSIKIASASVLLIEPWYHLSVCVCVCLCGSEVGKCLSFEGIFSNYTHMYKNSITYTCTCILQSIIHVQHHQAMFSVVECVHTTCIFSTKYKYTCMGCYHIISTFVCVCNGRSPEVRRPRARCYLLLWKTAIVGHREGVQ